MLANIGYVAHRGVTTSQREATTMSQPPIPPHGGPAAGAPQPQNRPDFATFPPAGAQQYGAGPTHPQAPQPGYPNPGMPYAVQQPPTKRPWFKKKRFIIPGALVALMVVAGALSGGGDTGAGQAPATAPASTRATETAAPAPATTAATTETAQATKTEAPAPAVNPFDERYGAFESVTTSGKGDSVIEVPAGVQAGLVTATHKGSANFAIWTLDENNEPTDLLVNTIGSYSGTTDFGLTGLGDAPAFIQITADGSWTVTLSPISSASSLGNAAEGEGDSVFTYDGPAGAAAITHTGSANFVVYQIDGGFPGLLVNEIGAYDGKVPFKKGPAVIVIRADGKWTVSVG